MIDLSIVIPVYNGASSIQRLVHQLQNLKIDDQIEIILVNDNSPDSSWEKILSIEPVNNTRLVKINLSKNFGEHNAVMAGYAHAKGNFIINIDDDFQNPPSEVIKVYQYAKSNPDLDVVYTFYDTKKHHFIRNIGSKFTNYISGFVIDKPKDLYLSSFRCINKYIVDKITQYNGPYPYIDGLILQFTSRIGKIKVDHHQREDGRSGYTLRKLVRLWLAMFLNFSVLPLRFSSMMGFSLSFLGVIMAIIAVIDRFYSDVPSGWASIMSGIMIFSGAQLVMLGIIGEYLGRLYLTTAGKPQHSICEIIESD